jgi:hypothetical protein
MNAPNSAGKWKVSDSSSYAGEGKVVDVEESVTSGRFCRSLRLGGCNAMGFAHWSSLDLRWAKVELKNKKVQKV